MNRRETDRNSAGNIYRRGKTGRRILTGILAFAMILTGQSGLAGVLAVRAEEETPRVITGFVPLSEETADQMVAVGTALEELALPGTLEAYVLSEDAENEGGGVEDTENPDPEDDEGETGDEEKPGNGEGEAGGEEQPGDNEGETGDEEKPGNGEGEAGGEEQPGDNEGETGGEEKPGNSEGETDGEEKPGSGEGEMDGEEKPGESEGVAGGEESSGGVQQSGAAEENGKSTETEQGAEADTASADGTLPRKSFWNRMTDAVTSWLAGILRPVRVEAAEAGTGETQDSVEERKTDAREAQDHAGQPDTAESGIGDGAAAADNDSAAPDNSTDVVNNTDAQPDAADTQEKVTIEGVTWESAPAYDTDTQGVYVFTPILPEGYTLAEDASLPEITVTVGCIHGIAGAGEVCPVCELQEQIDGLPEAEEVEEALYGMLTGTSRMSAEEIDALYELLCTLSDTYEGFPEEWQAMVDAEKLSALLALFSGEDMLMTTAVGKDVLVFSTKLRTGLFGNAPALSYLGVLAQFFADEGYGVQSKYGTKTEQHLTEADMGGIGLLILALPSIAPNDTDIALMRDFLSGGGRIVMIGENGAAYAKENTILSAAAEKLGADFRISDQSIGRRCSIFKGTGNMPENVLTKDVKQSLTSDYVAPIIYTGSTEPVLLLDGQAWMVDQAAGMGRITALTDLNSLDSLPGAEAHKRWHGNKQETADTKAWILRWLLDARDNQQMVLTNQDPNFGFSGSPGASVDAKEHMATLGDYSFTVTYSGSDKSPDGVIDETTVGTDDVTVTDSAGASLHVSGAQIISGQGTKKLTVRYTAEAQQSDYFTPGDYIIGIVNKAVSDKAGKQVNGNPKAAVFRVIASPLQITGPDNLVIPKGGTGSLSVTASAVDGKSYSYRYQWYQKKNGVYEPVSGATGASYAIPAAVTGVSGEYTYRCEVWANGHTEFRIPSQDALVTVEKGLAIDTPTATEIAGKDCDYTLSARLLEAGSDRITETGFVWGIMASPTLSLNSGSAKTASPVTAAGGTISVAATGLTKTVAYYGRAYVKTAGGNVVYSNAVSFGKTGNLGQFSVKNNGNNTFTVELKNGVGEQMVFYRTVNGSAVGGTHFDHKAGMLTFNGSGSQTVTVTEKSVTNTYGGKDTTAYSNADRTYSLEIYRPMGGATISTATATRTMAKNSAYAVKRTYYNGINKEVSTTIHNFFVADRTAKRTDDRVFFSSDRKDSKGGELNNVPDPYHSGFYKNFNVQRNMDSYFTEKEKAYLKATSVGYLYNLHIQALEDADAWEHIWIAKHAPDENAFNTSNGHDGPIGLDDSVKGAAQFTARWDIEGDGSSAIYADLYFPKATGTRLSGGISKNVRVGAQEGDFLFFGLDETVNVWFGASGKNEDIWRVYKYEDCFKMKDTVEPRLLVVAPMAQTAYAVGDNITIALVFDEIVDTQNSSLSNVKIKTNVTSDLSYSGGGDTNVLYFTGKVTTEFKNGDIQVNGITGSSYIKDMCETDGTANTSTSGSTPITTTGSSAPKLTLTNQSVTDGVAKAQISTQNATLLQYCWTQDAGMPAAGWHKAGSTSYTATNPAQTAGTYYLHAMAIRQDTGEAAYEKTSFTVTAQQQQEQENKFVLTAETDNSQWARSRTIRLEKKGSGSLTLTVKKPDGTTQTVTGDSYTATANGNYIFTLSNGSKTVTNTVAVSKIDRTNPKVTVGGIPTAWQPSVPTVTISGTDTGGSGIISLQYKWVTTKGAYPTSGLTSLSGTGVNVSGTASGSGLTDGVNYLYYKAVDAVGNTTQGYSSALRLDRIVPAITLGAAQVDGSNAVFSVAVKYGPSGGKATYQKQGDSTVLSVRGSTKGISETTYKFRLDATTGVNEAGTYTFTAASGAGKKKTQTAPGIYQVTLNAGEGVFQSDMRGEDEELPHTDIWLVVSGGKLVQPTYGAPVREHYTLKGWYTNSTCTTAYNFNTTVTANKTLYAGWTPDSYKVAYEKNGGTITNETTYQKYTYNTGLTLPTASQTKRTGYTFAGWYTDEAFADDTKVTELTKTDAGDKTFYARWTANQYTLTYDYQDATGGNGTASKQVTYDAAYGTLSAPTKTGYSFKGWYTRTGGAGDKVLETTKMTVAEDHTLYAYWVDDLKPDAPVLQDGASLPEDWTHTQKTIPLTLHDGVGVTELWVSVDDSDSYTKVSGFTGQPGNDSYDYVYEGVQEGNHIYRFQAKDAAKNESDLSEAFTVKLDTTEAALTVTGPNTGAEKKTGVVLTATSGSFGASGGVLSVKEDGQTEETALKDSAGSGVLETSYTVKETGTYHFYSRTKANKAADAGAVQTRYVRQVTFDSQGGSAVEPQLVWTSRTAGDAEGDGTVECRVKKPADPSYRGWVFGGWYTDQACTDAFDFDTQIYEDTTLYARWTADVYGVTYHLTNPDGSAYEAPDAYQTYVFGVGLTLPVPEQEGYRLEGWYLSDDYAGDALKAIGENETEAKEYYAHYVDIAAPKIAAQLSAESAESGWYTVKPVINLTYSDNQGVDQLWVSVDEEDWQEMSGFPKGGGLQDNTEHAWTYEALRQGDHTYVFQAVDAMGFSTKTDPVRVKLDTVKPVIGELTYENKVTNLWQWIIGKKSMVILAPVTDEGSDENAGSGVKKISYTMISGAAGAAPDEDSARMKTTTVENGKAEIVFDEDFRGNIAIACTDIAGNHADTVSVSASGEGGVIVEDSAPVIRFSTPAANAEGWHKERFDVNVAVTDDGQEDTAVISGGIARIEWKEGENGAEQIIEGLPGDSPEYKKEFSIPVMEDGAHTYYVKAADNAGNRSIGNAGEWETVTVKLDTTKPVIGEITYNEGYVNLWNWFIRKDTLFISIPVTEEMSGLARVTYTLTPGSMHSAEPVTKEAEIGKTETEAGTAYTAVIRIDPNYRGVIGDIRAMDNAGNVSETKTAYANGIGVIVEDEKPLITVTADRLPEDAQAGAAPGGEALSEEYYLTAPELLVKVQDGSMAASGIGEVKWRIGSGSEHTEAGGFDEARKTEYGFKVALNGNTGTVRAEISAVDNAGNSESKTVTVNIKGKEQTPEAEPDYPAERLTGLEPGAAYLVRLPGGRTVSRNADEQGEIGIDDGWFGVEISLIKKGDGKNTQNSDPQNLALAARPAAPILEKSDETIKGKKDGEVAGITAAMEISRDDKKTWEKAAGTVTDAAAGKLWARVTATQAAPCGKAAFVTVKEGRTLTVSFDAQGGSKVKPVKGLSWKEAVKKPTDPKKEGDNAFCGWYREAACENQWHFAAEPEPDLLTEDVTLWAKWLPRTAAPLSVGISYRDETLTELEPNAAYLIDGKEVIASAAGTVPIDESWFGKKINIVRRGDGTGSGDSNALRLAVPERPAGPAKVQPKAESAQDAKDGKLTKTDTTMQYRKKGSTEWITVTGEEITNLEPGDYELRYVSTDTAFSSKIVVKTVKKYSPPKKEGDDDGNDQPGGDDTDPGDGTEPGGGKEPGDGTEPGGGKEPGDGTEPGGGKEPGDGTEPGGGKEPGDGMEPGGGKEPGDGTKPGGSTDPEDGKPSTDDDVPIISVIIQDDVIVIGTPPGGTDDVTGGGDGNDSGGGNGDSGVYTGTADGMTTARTVLQMYDGGGNPTGAVIVTVVCEEQECTAGVADTMAVANAVLTPEQIQSVQKGSTIEIRIDVTDISNQVPPQDQEVIESGIGVYRKEHPQLTLGMYVDISMFIKTGDSDWNAVTETKEPVEVVIGIPEKLQSDERKFYIIRAHDGGYTFMEDLDEAADTITISTDLFSSYAIGYERTDGTGAEKCGLCHICPTFLGICYFIWLALIIAVLLIVILVAVRHRKKEETEEQK